LLLLLFNSWLVAPCSLLWAGDAVAVGYNSEGVWTAVTYYSSSTPKGGKDYKTEKEAQESALGDVRKRSEHEVVSAKIIASSDATGFVAVARGKDKSGKDLNVVGRGKSQAESDKEAFAQLSAARAGAKQKIVYRYFSHGADSK
jgi:hypothetical protein